MPVYQHGAWPDTALIHIPGGRSGGVKVNAKLLMQVNGQESVCLRICALAAGLWVVSGDYTGSSPGAALMAANGYD